jgi:aldose 1-epimerase
MKTALKQSIYLLFAVLIFAGCTKNGPSIKQESFGKLPDGREVSIYTLVNAKGYKVMITNWGAKIVSLEAPDRNGKVADVVLGYDKLEQYLAGDHYYGSTVGRYANRIAKGHFKLDSVEYTLPINDGPNSLHGGPLGFHSVLWNAEIVKTADYPSLKLTYHSPDKEEGYPGNMDVTVIYTWTADNALKIEYEATSDKNTVINLTNHAIFNLRGAGNGDILNHELMIAADSFTPIDSTFIPTGEIRPVKGTVMDFTTATAVGKRINDNYEQLVKGKGYDHNYVLRAGNTINTLAASVYEPESGRLMEVYTTEPGLQFYSGNFISGKDVGRGNTQYPKRSGLALEAQKFPDSPNQPAFPSCVLKKGEKYTQTSIYKFSTR